MAMSSGQKTELYNILLADANEVDKDGILTTLGKTMLGDNNTKDIARAKVLAALVTGDMTSAQIAELNTLLTRDGEEVDEGGLLRDAEKVFVGATQVYRCARARVLIDLLETIASTSVSPSMSISRSPSSSASATNSASPSRSPSVSPSASESRSPSDSASRSPSVSPSASPSSSLST